MLNKRLLIALVLASTATAGAQVVRGTVTERNSGTRLPGVVVTLIPEDTATVSAEAQTAASALTNERGEYAIRTVKPGTYRVSAKKIGVQRFISAPFTLGTGETHLVDVELEPALLSLPEVVVNVNSLCASKRTSVSRLASLWDEARTALTATAISRRDQLFTTNITRYVLALDPITFRVISESRVNIDSAVDRPFASLSGDSLSKIGYWREQGDSAEYYGPDAEVLLSDAFRRDHCYYIVDGGRDRRGLVGLSFEPVVGRTVPDIRGTLWLDSRTYELRFIEFHYTGLPDADYLARVGGEVHFAKTPGGAWIVSRWYLRMPQWGRFTSGPKAIINAYNNSALAVQRIREEGGSADAAGLDVGGMSGTITGTVVDSSGRPFRTAVLHLAGQRTIVTPDEKGHFEFTHLTAGDYTIMADDRGYAAFGLSAASASVTLAEAGTANATLHALRTREVIPRLCDGLPATPPRATLRLVIRDSTSGALVTGLPLLLSWAESVSEDAGSPGHERSVRATTDINGSAAFCALPPGVPIELSMERGNREPLAVTVFGLARNQVAARQLKVNLKP